MKNKHHSDKSKAKMRLAKVGKVLTNTHKIKIAKSLEKYSEFKLWLHVSGLYFYGTPITLKRQYPKMLLAQAALYHVYNNKASHHKGWVLLE